MIISLSGFMGCGKSSVGAELKSLLPDYTLVDLDDVIERREGRKIRDIFSSAGEAGFRAAEKEVLKAVLEEYGSKKAILSLGGGTLTTAGCAKLVAGGTMNFYLRASVDTLVYNLTVSPGDRPVLMGLEGDLRSKVCGLLLARAAVYEATAHHIIDIDGKDFPEIATEICAIVLK